MSRRLSRRQVVGYGLTLAAIAPLLQACGSSASQSTPVATNRVIIPTPTEVPPSPSATLTPIPTSVPTVAATATPLPGTMTSPDYAVQVFLWGSATAERDLGLAKEAGFRWVKQSIEWRYVEPHVKGTLEFNEPDRLLGLMSQLDLKLVARVDNQPVWARKDKIFPTDGPPDNIQDFADFLHALASRYKGRIQAYEIWNEPNLAREWGNAPPNPEQYIALLKAGYEAIKAADPDATVITAGLAPTTESSAIAMPDVTFVKEMYKAGASKYFDMLGAHGAGFKAPPDLSPDQVAKDPQYNHSEGANGRIYCFRHVEDIRQIMVDNGDAAKRLAILEFGWTTDPRPSSPYHWYAVTDQQQADYIVGAYQWATAHWQPWIGVMSLIYIAAPYWTQNDEEYYWSITNPDGTVRPAYRAIAAAKK